MFKVMQRRCPYGGAVSHSEAAAGWTAVKEQRRTALPWIGKEKVKRSRRPIAAAVASLRSEPVRACRSPRFIHRCRRAARAGHRRPPPQASWLPGTPNAARGCAAPGVISMPAASLASPHAAPPWWWSPDRRPPRPRAVFFARAP